jgi:hypothetical protein
MEAYKMDQKENREEILEKAYKLGQEYEARATDYCQSTIAAILDAIGIKDDALLHRQVVHLPEVLASVVKGPVGL